MPSADSTILEPRMACLAGQEDDGALECSVHTLPKPLLREFRHVFGEKYMDSSNNNNSMRIGHDNMELLAIPTNQQAREDLVGTGDHVEEEKDRLLNVFMDFGKEVCEKIRAMGFWADYIDPCSGLPMMTRECNKVYSEVDGMEVLLNYKAYNAGFCKVLTHPRWGTAVYPATMFAYGPRDTIVEIVRNYQWS